MPEFQQDDTFRLIFWRKTKEKNVIKTTENTPNKTGKNGTVNDTVNDDDAKKQVLFCVRQNPKYTLDKIAKKTGYSRRTVTRQMKVLQDTGIIKRIGSPKAGYWEVML